MKKKTKTKTIRRTRKISDMTFDEKTNHIMGGIDAIVAGMQIFVKAFTIDKLNELKEIDPQLYKKRLRELEDATGEQFH